MTYYHCSPIAGIPLLEPRKPETFDKPARVYLTASLPMALMYGIRNYEYSYGYTKAGQQLYHGSSVPALAELRPLSVLHGTDEKVVYLSSSVPYTLLYIWDEEKTQYSHKWVTGWVKDGIAYYEEQFPGQLKAFYEGVRGYVYSVLKSGDVQTFPNREDLFYSRTPIRVYRVTEIPDVYQALLEYERAGKFRVLRFESASEKKQAELTDRIATYISENNLPEQDSEESRFMKRYFAKAWEKARNKLLSTQEI